MKNSKPKRVKLEEIPEGIDIYICGDAKKKQKNICGLDGELVAYKCDGCLFQKAKLKRSFLKTKTKIYYRRIKNRPS